MEIFCRLELLHCKFLPSQTKLQKGNVFMPVCHSVHRWGRCTPPGRHPLPGIPPPPPPLGRHPRGQTSLLGRHPPPDGHCSKRYASYWNAFLFSLDLLLHTNLFIHFDIVFDLAFVHFRLLCFVVDPLTRCLCQLWSSRNVIYS